MSSSSGDLLPEMMESETPPPDSSAPEAGDPEVSSRRASPSAERPKGDPIDPRGSQCPAPEEGRKKSPAPSSVRSDVLRELVGRAAISDDHRVLMNMVMERISSAESGLHEAFMRLLTGFEVRKKECVIVLHMLGVPCVDSSP